jgi:hypothetical protein
LENREITSTTRALMPLLITLLLEEKSTSPSAGAECGIIERVLWKG